MNKHWHLAQLQEEERIVAGKIMEERMIRHRESLAQALAERDAAREELARLKAAQPAEEAALGSPLDAIRVAERLIEQLPKSHEGASSWLMNYGTGERARECRAQWKERMSAEAPVAEPDPEAEDADARARFDPGARVTLVAEPAAPLVSVPRVSLAEPAVEAPKPVVRRSTPLPPPDQGFVYSDADIQPAAPAQEQEGPFRAFGFLYVKRGAEPAIGCMDTPQRDEVLRLLNAGLEAPKLRARVAELERLVGDYVRDRDSEQARADSAVKRVAQLERAVAFHESAAKEIAAERDAAEAKLAEREQQIDSMQEASASFVRERNELKAKLAALGDNPIPRALVERHLESHHPDNREAAVCRAILAGREPGVAS